MAFSDDTGSAFFEKVRPGAYEIRLVDKRHGPAARNVVAVANQDVRAELRAPEPGRLDLAVARAEGGPAAWAQVYLTHELRRPWHDVDSHGTLHLEPRLDHAGRILCHRVPAGTVEVLVTWHGRRVKQAVDVRPGETAKLALTLPAHPAWSR